MKSPDRTAYRMVFLIGSILPWIQFIAGPLGVLFFGWRKDIKYLALNSFISIVLFAASVSLWDGLFRYAQDGGGLIFVFWISIIYPLAFIISLMFPVK